MTDAETRVLGRAVAVLLVASVARYGLELRKGPPVIVPDSGDVLPGLLADSRAERADQERRGRRLAEGERIDPNRAPDAELDRLPGIGPAVALRIVEERERGGPFRDADDLGRVRGLGPATIRKLVPLLDFGSVPTAGRGRAAGRPDGPARGGPHASARSRPPAAVGILDASGPGRATVGVLDARGAPGRGGIGPPAAGPRSGPGANPAAAASRVDLNAAGAAELEGLPGVGPALAERILEARRRKGRFAALEELLEVRGIGPATLERLRPRLEIR